MNSDNNLTVGQVYNAMSPGKKMLLQLACGGMLTDDVDPDNIAVALRSHMAGLTEEEEKVSAFIVGKVYKQLGCAERTQRREELRKNPYLYAMISIYGRQRWTKKNISP